MVVYLIELRVSTVTKRRPTANNCKSTHHNFGKEKKNCQTKP